MTTRSLKRIILAAVALSLFSPAAISPVRADYNSCAKCIADAVKDAAKTAAMATFVSILSGSGDAKTRCAKAAASGAKAGVLQLVATVPACASACTDVKAIASGTACPLK